MAPSQLPHRALALAAVALSATGCIGPFRRAFAPEQRVSSCIASRRAGAASTRRRRTPSMSIRAAPSAGPGGRSRGTRRAGASACRESSTYRAGTTLSRARPSVPSGARTITVSWSTTVAPSVTPRRSAVNRRSPVESLGAAFRSSEAT